MWQLAKPSISPLLDQSSIFRKSLRPLNGFTAEIGRVQLPTLSGPGRSILQTEASSVRARKWLPFTLHLLMVSLFLGTDGLMLMRMMLDPPSPHFLAPSEDHP